MLIFGNHAFLFWLPGVFLYIIAYYIGKYWNKVVSDKMMFFLTILLVASLIMRVFVKLIADGSRLYDNVVFEYSQCIFACWIFFFIFWLCSKKNIIKYVAPIAKCCDRYSFEVYIVHNAFLSGVLSFQFLTTSLVLNTITFIGITIVFSIGLYWIANILKGLFS